ncbi:MAG: RsmB/NOP family class I SAM-dependent RNA methyltransferase, partial [Alphaproteobacteria bacterium]
TPISPDGIRLPTAVGADRLESVRATKAILQDEASQIAVRFVMPAEGRQIAELGAGGGGKTLALADLMKASGQIYAFDSDARRLEETRRRAREAKVTNLQCHRLPRFGEKRVMMLARFAGLMDRVFVDAPCSGSGTWRRHPDVKWRLDAERLAELVETQKRMLGEALALAGPEETARVVYVTCSLLPEENEDVVAAVLAEHPGWRLLDYRDLLDAAGLPEIADSAALPPQCLQLTPARHGTDGLFVAVLVPESLEGEG